MISGSNWSTTLQGLLTGKGFVGDRLKDFTDAVGDGGELSTVGKAFVTADVGFVPGSGVGAGVGVIGLSSATISMVAFALAVGFFGQSGTKLLDVTDAVGDACVSELGLALLTSTHAPVFSGVGTIVPGSIAVLPSGWGSNIESAAPSFVGSQWGNFASALGEGQADNVGSDGTGSVVISGGGVPVPGAGAGVGVLS